jgi:hypothetical protein
MYRVAQIMPEECASYWRYVKKYLNRAIKRSGGRWKKEYVLAALATRQHSLWIITGDTQIEGRPKILGAVTTQIILYPEKKFLMIHFLGGDGIDDWYYKLSETLTNYAADMQCDGIETISRAGFWKFFKNDGFFLKSQLKRG